MDIKPRMGLHNKLYTYADKLLKKYNPCEIEKGKCIYGNFCCDGCKYLTENGCSVKCLWCKLWLCYSLCKQHKHQPLILKLNKIRTIASKNNLLIIRGSEEDLRKS